MPETKVPKIAIAGKAPFTTFEPSIGTLLAHYAIDIEFVEMEIGSPSLGFMVDMLEYLPKGRRDRGRHLAFKSPGRDAGKRVVRVCALSRIC